MTPTPDEICKRLRLAVRDNTGWEPSMSVLERAADEAADLIQQQLAEIERLSAEKQVRDLIQQQHATIERLSAALAIIERGTVDDAFGKPVKITLFRMRSIARAALGKDASDVRSPGSSEGE